MGIGVRCITIFVKERTALHEKCHVILDTDSLVNTLDKLTLNFTKRTTCFLSIEKCEGSWVLPDKGLPLRPFKRIAVFVLCMDFTDACNIRKGFLWYHPIDVEFISLHEKFEGRLSITSEWERPTRYKLLPLKVVKLLKSPMFWNSDAPPTFMSFMVKSHLLCQSFWYDWNLNKRVMSWRWF